MKASIISISIPKEGHEAQENEDAASYRAERHHLRAAVADGATDSLFSGVWARMLADGFVASDASDPDALSSELVRWREAFEAVGHGQHAEIPWYVAHRIEEGAHAAFLGVTVEGNGSLNAFAVGDCCLLWIDHEGMHSWPLSDPNDFGHRPPLIGSRGGYETFEQRRLEVSRGDRILLATDAAAEWLMRRDADALREVDEAALSAALIRERRRRWIRNDDLTVLLIDFL